MSKRIPLTQGKIAIVDDDDYKMLSRFKWCARKRDDGLGWYACRKEKINGRQHQQQMHRLILNAPKGVLCDHKNGNGLDNRKSNLRLANYSQNSHNCKIPKNNTTGFKGVTDAGNGKFYAYIRVNLKLIYLGAFKNKIDAARAYNSAAIVYHGEFARLNKV